MDRQADNDLATAARWLADGGIVCFPTESSYGLAARLDRPSACAEIARIKQREPGSPFPVIAASMAAAMALAKAWPPAATDLAARHWPGPLTLVVPAADNLPVEVIGPGGGVGVRVSSHPIAHDLAKLAGPITATSANRRGESPATTIEAARVGLDGTELYFLDDGPCLGGPPSTVVAVSPDGGLSVLRPGAIDVA